MVMDNWTVTAAQIVNTILEHPGKSQEELGKIAGIKQNAISNRIRRAYFNEIMEVDGMFANKLVMME